LLLRELALQPRPGFYPGDSGRFFKLDAPSGFLVTQPAPGILMREHLSQAETAASYSNGGISSYWLIERISMF